MRDVLHAIAKAGRPPIAMLSAAQAKQGYALGAAVLEVNAQKMARDDTLQIPVRDGAVLRAKLWAEHATPNLPVLLYFHGGGFTVGSPETHEALCKHLAHLAHCAVVSLDYRLAPEHRFPTAVHDAWDALNWLHQHGQTPRPQPASAAAARAAGFLLAPPVLCRMNAGSSVASMCWFTIACVRIGSIRSKINSAFSTAAGSSVRCTPGGWQRSLRKSSSAYWARCAFCVSAYIALNFASRRA